MRFISAAVVAICLWLVATASASTIIHAGRLIDGKSGAAQSEISIVIDDGRIFISSTVLNGRFTLRFACLAFRTHLKTVDTLLTILRDAVS